MARGDAGRATGRAENGQAVEGGMPYSAHTEDVWKGGGVADSQAIEESRVAGGSEPERDDWKGGGVAGRPPRGAGPRMLKGAAVMGIAMLISKTIGTLQKIPLQNIAGDRVFGIYNAVYPMYQLLLVMVTAGFPVAVSLLVAEQEAAGDRAGSVRVLNASILLLGAAGAAGFAIMWGGAGRIALWIGDAATAPAVRAAALALWITPAMAALRGYYQGLGQMTPSAVSQLSEQTVRVAGMLALLLVGWHLGWSDASLAAGATAGSAIGGIVGLAVITIWLIKDLRRNERGNETPAEVMEEGRKGESKIGEGVEARRSRKLGLGFGTAPITAARISKEMQHDADDADVASNVRHARSEGASTQGVAVLMRRLAGLALPVTLGALALPALGVVDAFTVPRLLRGSGIGEADAMALFGLYSRGQPLVQLVAMVAGAIGSAMVPALAAARVRGDKAAVRRHAAFAMRAAWTFGAAAALGLVLLAEPINVMLYADNEGTRTFMLVGCTAFAGTVSGVSAALLQGLGAVRAPALFMLAAAAFKAALNAALVPAFGTAGAACAGIAALTAAALLGAGAVRRAAGAAVPARGAAGIGLALACMAAALVLAERGLAPLLGLELPPRAAAAALALGGTALGAAVFAAAMLRCGGIGAHELRALQGGEALAARLRRWRLLPPQR